MGVSYKKLLHILLNLYDMQDIDRTFPIECKITFTFLWNL